MNAFFFQSIEWEIVDASIEFTPVIAIPDLVSISADNVSLVFAAFASDRYSSLVHAAKYRCKVENADGVIVSNVVDVRAGEIVVVVESNVVEISDLCREIFQSREI